MTAGSMTKSNAFPWWATLMNGIFAIFIGILLLTNPLASMVVVVTFIGIYWLVTGIFALVGIFIDSSMWGWKLFMGILGVLAGILVLQHPMWSSFLLPAVLVVVMGVNGLIMGVMGLIAAFSGAGWGAGVLSVLSIIIGILLLGSPVVTGMTLPWVFGIFAIVGGILAVFGAFQQRKLA